MRLMACPRSVRRKRRAKKPNLMPNPGCLCRRSAIGAFRCFEHLGKPSIAEGSLLVQLGESFENRPEKSSLWHRSFVVVEYVRPQPVPPRRRPHRRLHARRAAAGVRLDQTQYQRESLSSVAGSACSDCRGRRGASECLPGPAGNGIPQKGKRQIYGVEPDWILPANGSDECLTLITRGFVNPGETICFPYPSYILYETLADLAGGPSRTAAAESRLVMEPQSNCFATRALQTAVCSESQLSFG